MVAAFSRYCPRISSFHVDAIMLVMVLLFSREICIIQHYNNNPSLYLRIKKFGVPVRRGADQTGSRCWACSAYLAHHSQAPDVFRTIGFSLASRSFAWNAETRR
jgi:hypothetical protein